VSIEDLVEEVVGEIEDEHDDHNDRLMSGRLETGLTASARTPIEDLEEKINIDLYQDEERDDDIDTLGGLVFSLVGRVPVRGEIVTHPAGLEIEVLSADPRRIKTLKISIKK
jgi:CBS domain containing-hemolysin-like protein